MSAELQPDNVVPITSAAAAAGAPGEFKKSPPMFTLRNRKSKEDPSTEELLANINRSLPFSDEAEKGVLSGILHDPNERLSEARTSIPIEAFNHAANRIVYTTLLSFYDRNTPLDVNTLIHALREQQVIEKVGGAAAISELYGFIPVSAHYEFYKKVLIDKHLLRQMIHACSLNIHYAYEHGREHIDEEINGELDRAEQRVLAVRQNSKSDDGIKSLNTHIVEAIEAIHEMVERPGQLRGVSTGYGKLDMLSAGLQAGDMFVIAARPSMGKTSLAMNIVEHMAVEQNLPTAVFSLEMSAAMLVRRLLVSRARISMSTLQRGLLTHADQGALMKATKDLQKSQIFIDETPGLDIMEMRAKCRRLHKQYGIKAIAIDYLQLLTSSSRKAKDNRQIEIAEISAGIKGIAKELKVPVIVLAQLNRSVEGRKGQRPMLSDLRESGSIEQDADMVGLLTRKDYAGSKQVEEDDDRKGGKGKDRGNDKDKSGGDDDSDKGKAVLIIAKNRNGPTGDVPLTFVDYSMRFIEREADEDEKD
jgi:replicative DNA helicase